MAVIPRFGDSGRTIIRRTGSSSMKSSYRNRKSCFGVQELAILLNNKDSLLVALKEK